MAEPKMAGKPSETLHIRDLCTLTACREPNPQGYTMDAASNRRYVGLKKCQVHKHASVLGQVQQEKCEQRNQI
ncbi:MAG: hypothetical protein NVS2B16_18990 [Chloroflexota bacterium]